MKTSIVAGSLLAALSLAAPLRAQQVAADVVLRSGPVAGHVVIGDGYSTYRRPVVYRAPARVIVVERVVPRVVVVERLGHRNAASLAPGGSRGIGRWSSSTGTGVITTGTCAAGRRCGRWWCTSGRAGSIARGTTTATVTTTMTATTAATVTTIDTIATGTTDLSVRLPAPDRPDPGRLHHQISPPSAGIFA